MFNCVMFEALFSRLICNYLFYLYGKSNFQLRLLNYFNDEVEQAKSDEKGSLISNLRSTFKTSRIMSMKLGFKC